MIKVCILALWTTIISNAQATDDFNSPESIEENEFIEMDTIQYDGDNIGMAVYYGTVDKIWASPDDLSVVQQLDILSYVLGSLENDRYYQTWFQFPDPTSPGLYESFTCTAKYNKYSESSNIYGVRTYQGMLDFSD